MPISYYLAQIMGPYLFLMGLAMLIHPERFKVIMKQFQENKALLTYSGVVSLILGLILVTAHNYWDASWPVVITLLSWILLIKALFRIFFLDQFILFTQRILNQSGYNWMCWVSVIVGAYLSIMGFFG